MTCDICGDSPTRYRHDWLRKCPRCGVLSADFAVEIPDTPSASHLDEDARAVGLDTLRRRNNALLVKSLQNDPLVRGKVLDVGCGPGFFLSAAVEGSLDAEGIEPDANVIAAAGQRGAKVRHGHFPAALDANERFDAIIFNDVFEHIPDLKGAMAAAVHHLNPGGLLVLNCPDKRGLFFRVAAAIDRLGVHGPYDRLWQRGLPSPHVWYFTPAMLTRAASKAGLKPSGTVRLATVDLHGLWSRIRMVKSTPFPMALAAFTFTWATYPLARLLPSDSTACFFRKPL